MARCLFFAFIGMPGLTINAAHFPIVFGTGLGGLNTSPRKFQRNAHFLGRLAEWSYFYTLNIHENAIKKGIDLSENDIPNLENGKLMFIYQAFEAFKLWHKVQPEINEDLKNFLDS